MEPRAVAAAAAAVALVAFAATLGLASGPARLGSGLAALRGGETGDRAAQAPPDRPAPQPALTGEDIPPGAADTGASAAAGAEREPDGRPQRHALATAPREVILYARGCGEWWATEPWEGGRRFRVEGVASCRVQWTPDGELASVRRSDLGDTVVLTGRNGRQRTVLLTGQRVEGPMALGDRVEVACGRSGGRATLYRWRPGTSVPHAWREGCLPALAPDGSLAYALTPPFRPRRAALLMLHRPGRLPQRLAAWPGGEVRSVGWTGDGRWVVAVVELPDGLVAVAVDPASGEARDLARVDAGGALVAHPSPAGARVVLVVAPPDGPASIQTVNATRNEERWSAPVDGVVDVSWSPSGSRLLIADREAWTFVEPATGRTRLVVDRLGDAPSWCCPDGGGA